MELHKKSVRQLTLAQDWCEEDDLSCRTYTLSAIEMYTLTGCYLFLLCYLEQVVLAKSYPRLDVVLGE